MSTATVFEIENNPITGFSVKYPGEASDKRRAEKYHINEKRIKGRPMDDNDVKKLRDKFVKGKASQHNR
ncbi:MAG: hypothetical protein LBB23_00570 [Rickettsiales bacterium]|jgi:hypothetical protein|nr:hypothetical protein [Rickettsiales bacterium]